MALTLAVPVSESSGQDSARTDSGNSTRSGPGSSTRNRSAGSVSADSAAFGRPAEAARAAEYETVFRENWDPLVRMAGVLVGSRAEAEEIAQEALARWYVRRSSTENPDAFLRRVVTNLSNSRHRRRAVVNKYAALFESDARNMATTDGHIEEFAARNELLVALAKLAPRQRSAVYLRYYERRTENEIAEILDCRPGTVKSLLSRAISELQQVMRPTSSPATSPEENAQ